MGCSHYPKGVVHVVLVFLLLCAYFCTASSLRIFNMNAVIVGASSSSLPLPASSSSSSSSSSFAVKLTIPSSCNDRKYCVSKRRVPNGPDPIHNRRAGKSTRPGRV